MQNCVNTSAVTPKWIHSAGKVKILEDLLTLADSSQYYKNGAEPWPKEWQEQTPDGRPRSEGENKVNDNIKLLLRDRDRLQENQFRLRRMMKRIIYCAAIAVIASWSPLWLPLLKRLARIN
jgi:hypothetical protein